MSDRETFSIHFPEIGRTHVFHSFGRLEIFRGDITQGLSGPAAAKKIQAARDHRYQGLN